MIKIFILGQEIDYIKVEAHRDMDNLCGTFSFETSVNAVDRYSITLGDLVTIEVNSDIFLRAYIEQTTDNLDSNTHNIFFSGREINCDLVDSSFIASNDSLGFYEAKSPNIISIAKDLIAISGLSYSVFNQTGLDDSALTVNNNQDFLQNGQSIFNYLKNLSKQLKVLLNSDGLGNLVITRSVEIGPTLVDKLLQRRLNFPKQTNIKSSSLSLNHSNLYAKYRVKGIVDATSELAPEDFNNVSDIVGDEYSFGDARTQLTTDKRFNKEFSIRKNRISLMTDYYVQSQKDATERAKWMANLSLSRALDYQIVLASHDSSYKLNTMVKVIDDMIRPKINGYYLIKGISINQSYSGGVGSSETQLQLTFPKAYKAQVEMEANSMFI